VHTFCVTANIYLLTYLHMRKLCHDYTVCLLFCCVLAAIDWPSCCGSGRKMRIWLMMVLATVHKLKDLWWRCRCLVLFTAQCSVRMAILTPTVVCHLVVVVGLMH